MARQQQHRDSVARRGNTADDRSPSLPGRAAPDRDGASHSRSRGLPDDRRRALGRGDEPGESIALLLADKRSEQTRRAYRGDLIAFFGAEPSEAEVRAFVALPAPKIAARLARWKATMLAEGKAPATVNRRLAAVRSLLKFCHRLGLAQSDGRSLIDGERALPYRDTRGVPLKTMREILGCAIGKTEKARRDEAILRLLCENALRRAEVTSLDVADFDGKTGVLQVRGKGKSGQKCPVTLSPAGVAAIRLYLKTAGHKGGALFRNLARDPKSRGGRITGQGIYDLVAGYGRLAGVEHLTPHKLRHSAITAALDAFDGNVRLVRQLSRHAQIETLMRYDDARRDGQGQVTKRLSGLLA